MSCPYGFNGTAEIASTPKGPEWRRADSEIHVADELGLDSLLLARYAIGESCPAWPGTRHARLRSDL